MRRIAEKIQAVIGEYGELLAMVEKQNLRWFGHISGSSGIAILQGTVKGKKEEEADKGEVRRQY